MQKIVRNLPQYSFWLLFFILARGLLVSQGRTSATEVNSGVLIELGITILLCFLVICDPLLITRLKGYASSPILLLIAYYLLGVLSYFWSAIPLFSLVRSTQAVAIFFAVGMYMYKTYAHNEVENRFYKLCFVVIVIRFINVAKGGIQGWGWHSVDLPACASICLCYTLGRLFSGTANKKHIKIIYLMFFVVIVTTSSGTIVSLVVSLFVASFFIKNSRLQFLVMLIIALCVCYYLLCGTESFISILFSGKSIESIQSAHGRTTLWANYFDMFTRRPWLGYGFATGSRLGEIYTTNTHNFFFAALVNSGIIGVLLLFLYVFLVWLKSLSVSLSDNRGLNVLMVYTLVFTNNLTYAFIGEQWSSATIVFFAFVHLAILIEKQPQGAMYCR